LSEPGTSPAASRGLPHRVSCNPRLLASFASRNSPEGGPIAGEKLEKKTQVISVFMGFQWISTMGVVYCFICFTKGEHRGRQASPSHTMREIVFHRAPGLFAHAELHRGQGGLVHLRSESASGPLAFEK